MERQDHNQPAASLFSARAGWGFAIPVIKIARNEGLRSPPDDKPCAFHRALIAAGGCGHRPHRAGRVPSRAAANLEAVKGICQTEAVDGQGPNTVCPAEGFC